MDVHGPSGKGGREGEFIDSNEESDDMEGELICDDSVGSRTRGGGTTWFACACACACDEADGFETGTGGGGGSGSSDIDILPCLDRTSLELLG
jgi:hypothetical protein